MSIISDTVELPLIGLDWLWKSVAPGPAHPALGIGDMWVAEDDRPRVAQAINEGLGQQGLGSLNEPAPELVATLRLLATASEEYYAWVNGVTSNFTGAVLVAGNGTEAVRMARDQQAIGFAPAPTEDLAGLLVDAFKPTDPADIPKLSMPKKDFSVEAPAQDAHDDEEFTFTYEEDRDEVDPATRLRNLMQAKREAIYQIYTAKRSGGTSRKRVGPYAVVDIIDEGRVVTFVDESGAEPMIQCLPAGRDDLVKVLTEAHAALG